MVEFVDGRASEKAEFGKKPATAAERSPRSRRSRMIPAHACGVGRYLAAMRSEAPTPPRFRPLPLAWVGFATIAFGSGPLVVTLLAARAGLSSDPNPNPVGFGILAFLTFWPGVVLFVIGLAQSFTAHAKARREHANRGVGVELPSDPRERR